MVVVIFALLGGYRYNQQVQNLRMESLYFKMVKLHDQKPGKDSPDNTGELETLLGQFNAGPQQVRASLLVAEEYFRK